jgi:pyruvate ferredoxin oxidoreductase alpha subunit
MTAEDGTTRRGAPQQSVQMEGSAAVAATVARCRPEVIAAYPISPQTHIVEGLSALVASGTLTPCEFLNVESEYGAMSACIGASATGARTYTATASQGLLYMAEALYNASGLALPIVMTVANRAIGAPINILNDHSDAMSQRDSGWVQLYASSNQEAIDLHVQAFRLAESVGLPVMVCMDGFTLTHAFEHLRLPDQAAIDAYLPRFEPRQLLDPGDPVTIGAMVGAEAFTEVKYLGHLKQRQALDHIPELAASFEQTFGRTSGGLVSHYRTSDAETILIALGSVLGTVQQVVDELRAAETRIGALGITTFRPWPGDEVAAALAGARRVVVLERALATGRGGVLSPDITVAAPPDARVNCVIAGLGGRPVTRASLRGLVQRALADRLGELTFLDLDAGLIEQELARMKTSVRSGPHAENMLRDLVTGTTA